MFENILKILNSNDWNFVGDESIRIAKGKYELPLTKAEKRKRLRDTIEYAKYTIKNTREERTKKRFIKKIKDSIR